MALSKRFLCGTEEAFDKDENLSLTFEFAMGYHKAASVVPGTLMQLGCGISS